MKRPARAVTGGADRYRYWPGSLFLLAAISLGSAYLPLGVGTVTLNLVIAAVMAIVLAIFLMDLRTANTLSASLRSPTCSGRSSCSR